MGLICGGFPCQGFSIAGKRKGEADDRYLWPEFFRLIQEIRPDWVIGENVAGIINLGLDTVLADLEGKNYSVQTFVIPACALNAPHRRDRVWIVAHTNQNSEPTINEKRLSDADPNARRCEQDKKISARGNTVINGSDNVAYPESSGLEGWQVRGVGDQTQPQFGAGCWSVTSHWRSEPDVGRVAHGVPRRMDRLRQLGNAVVPQIPEMIGKAIMEIAA